LRIRVFGGIGRALRARASEVAALGQRHSDVPGLHVIGFDEAWVADLLVSAPQRGMQSRARRPMSCAQWAIPGSVVLRWIPAFVSRSVRGVSVLYEASGVRPSREKPRFHSEA
jgi:hypothetical protein